MKSSLRAGLLVGVLATLLIALTAVAVLSVWQLGSSGLAVTVAVAGVAAVVVVGLAWWFARDAERQVAELLPPLRPEAPAAPAARRGFKVRHARPGEVPEPYLAAVRKGAQARQAAWKASAPPDDSHPAA